MPPGISSNTCLIRSLNPPRRQVERQDRFCHLSFLEGKVHVGNEGKGEARAFCPPKAASSSDSSWGDATCESGLCCCSPLFAYLCLLALRIFSSRPFICSPTKCTSMSASSGCRFSTSSGPSSAAPICPFSLWCVDAPLLRDPPHLWRY